MSRFAKLVNAKVSGEQTPPDSAVPPVEPVIETLAAQLLNEHEPASTTEGESVLPTPPTPRTPPTDGTARTPRTPPTSIAPERDFTRFANSILREGVAGGYFTGKSKQLYDFLYTRTRGAVVPTKTVNITKPNLMKGAHIGSERTLLKNIQHLKAIGLIEVDYTDGKHVGNTYIVSLPEEVGLRTLPTPPTPPTPRHAGQKVGYVPPVESGVRGVGIPLLESTTYETPKTLSFNTNTEENDDDEALADFTEALKKAAKDVTGRELSASEKQRWAELADVLVTELKIAAGRTTVSSVPAFLAEHLRRRLWKKEKRQIETEAAEAKASPKLDISRCPDCFGTSMHYPEGFDKGVARCDHKRLTENESASN